MCPLWKFAAQAFNVAVLVDVPADLAQASPKLFSITPYVQSYQILVKGYNGTERLFRAGVRHWPSYPEGHVRCELLPRWGMPLAVLARMCKMSWVVPVRDRSDPAPIPLLLCRLAWALHRFTVRARSDPVAILASGLGATTNSHKVQKSDPV